MTLLDKVEAYLANTERFLEVAGQEWRDEWFDLSAFVADLRDGEDV
jgi:hypothetical protein